MTNVNTMKVSDCVVIHVQAMITPLFRRAMFKMAKPAPIAMDKPDIK